MAVDTARHFFEGFSDGLATDFFVLPQSGSARANYIAVSDKGKFVVTYNENLRENRSFFYFSKIFSGLKLNTPKILSISEDETYYVQEFLGEKTLSELLEQGGLTDKTKSLVRQTLEKLFILQKATTSLIDYSQAFEYERYDEIPILHDLNYFKFLFVDVIGLPYQKSALLKEFKKIAELIEALNPKGLMIRDFQSRNIMVDKNGGVSFIDYQSAMEGPLMYDVVSFLYQAKANFPEEFRQQMLDFYMSKFDMKNQTDLRNSIEPLKLIRFTQVLGAYGLRGLVEKKKHFLASIEKGIQNLYQFSNEWSGMNNFPEFKKLILALHSKNTDEKIKSIINGQ